MHARLLHAPVRVRCQLLIECAARIRIGPDLVAGLAQRESEEGGALSGAAI